MLLSTPRLVQKSEQDYAAIRVDIDMRDISSIVPPLLPRIYSWLAEQKLEPAGPPFFRYLSVTGKQVVVEAAVPLPTAPPGSSDVLAATLPAGHYAVVLHTGHYSGLKAAHMALESWGENQGLRWHQCDRGDRTDWGCRTETYLNDPDDEPNPARWQTEIAFLLADDQLLNIHS